MGINSAGHDGERPWPCSYGSRRLGAALFERPAILKPPSLRRSPLSASSPVRFCGCLSLRLRRWLLLAEAPGAAYGQLLLVASLPRLSARILLIQSGEAWGPRGFVARPLLRSASPALRQRPICVLGCVKTSSSAATWRLHRRRAAPHCALAVDSPCLRDQVLTVGS